MIRLVLLFSLFVFSFNAFSQEENYVAPTGLNNWYVELGGSALFYSINYEKYLYRNRDETFTWLGRVGIGYNPINYKFLDAVYLDKNSFMVPFATTILKGAGKEKLEIGGGFTMLTKNFLDREIVPNAIIGLRVMETNRVCFRVTYTPLFRSANAGGTIHWLGVSLGKNFNFK